MSVRNLKELGVSLQKIITRLLENDELIKLLYYADQDPLSQPALDEKQKRTEVFQKLIKIVPEAGPFKDTKSVLYVYVSQGIKYGANSEFRNIQIVIDSLVPLTTWMIKDSNLRPFAILGEIQKSLDGKTINQIGKLESGDFSLVDLTEENSVYRISFTLTQYD